MESEAQGDTSVSVTGRIHRVFGWIRTNSALFAMVLAVALIALVPLYGILFPPLVDLPDHILLGKLLWEKLTGVSHLDLEISWFIGYRLFSALMMIVIPLCKLGGISLAYLPGITAMMLMSLHAIAVGATIQLQRRSL